MYCGNVNVNTKTNYYIKKMYKFIIKNNNWQYYIHYNKLLEIEFLF